MHAVELGAPHERNLALNVALKGNEEQTVTIKNNNAVVLRHLATVSHTSHPAKKTKRRESALNI